MKIAIIGGTGQLGYGLALRFARAGHEVCIGSRTAERAEEAARGANAEAGVESITGAANAEAAAAADLVVVAVPYEAQEATLGGIRDAVGAKVLVDATVPLAEGNPLKVAPPPEGSAAERAQARLPEARVVGAFHHVGARALKRLDHPVDIDLLVCGDDQEAKQTVMGLAAALGTRGIDCGPLFMAQTLERITPLLIGLNIRFKKRHTGIRITGL